MLCSTCSRLALLSAKKSCVRCQAVVFNNISVLCETCSTKHKQCSVCMKNIITPQQRNAGRGCGCGKK